MNFDCVVQYYERLEKENEKLKKENEELRKVLKFYSYEHNFFIRTNYMITEIYKERTAKVGTLAKETLEKLNEK